MHTSEYIHTYIRCGRQGTAALQHTRDCNWAAQTQTIDSLDCIRRAVFVSLLPPGASLLRASAQLSSALRPERGKYAWRRRDGDTHTTPCLCIGYYSSACRQLTYLDGFREGREMHQLSGAQYSSSNSYKGADI